MGDHERATRTLQANLEMLSRVPPAARTPSVKRWAEQIYNEFMRIHSPTESSDDEGWARQALALLRTIPGVDGGDARQVSKAGYSFQRSISELASNRRRSRGVDACRQSVKRMHAFGRVLVAAFPDCPAAHLAISEAFRQSAKDAFATNDINTVERNWKWALDEARQAVLLDPRDACARDNVVVLERKLRGLVAPQRDSIHPGPNAVAAGLGR
jgi:hypothetical protein